MSVAKALEPTFGGINLEDIKAPDCFYVEEKLRETMNIPVFHDDQHGTAIISSAALTNALEIVGKDISKAKIVINGAGAAAIACTKLYVRLGAKVENVFMCDSKGLIYKGRPIDMNPYKEQFAQETVLRSLAQVLVGADVFVGLSVANVMTKEMVRSMAKDPIVFAMANPDPEITYEDATACRADVIVATGRSDYPNQVNNVLGFPFIFRGALDVRARTINEEMKIAAVKALASLAKEPVPDSVKRAYGGMRARIRKRLHYPEAFRPEGHNLGRSGRRKSCNRNRRREGADDAMPAMVPNVLDESGEGIYGEDFVPRESAVKNGVVIYARPWKKPGPMPPGWAAIRW